MGGVNAKWSLPPDGETLHTTLARLFAAKAPLDAAFTVVRRELLHKGAVPKEIVTCRWRDGREIRLFGRYEAGHSHDAHGHRGRLGLKMTRAAGLGN